MAFDFQGIAIRKIGVVGSGQIGPDIALHLAKTFHEHQVPVIVVDVSQEALAKGRAKLVKKVEKGVQSGAFTPQMGEAMVQGTVFTQDYEQLRGVDLVIEAASEDLALKRKIFQSLESLCPETTVLASNSSHLEPEVIFENLKSKKRALVIHYFFPAERNPLVELVPSADTDPKVVSRLMSLYEHLGKVPIQIGSRYGYAVDPIFEGLFLASALCVEEGLGSIKEVDTVGCKALGLKIGSFTAMNLTGGNPLSDHGLDMSHERLNPWYHSPRLLKEAMRTGKPWEVPQRGEKIEVDPARAKTLLDALRGAYFGLAGQIIDSGITNVADLEMGLEVALDLTPPFKLMNQVGVRESLALVEKYAQSHPGFPVPRCLTHQAQSGQPWAIDFVSRQDQGDVALLRIRRPTVLNALNQEVFGQLKRHFQAIRQDSRIRAVVLTGFGNKAFVSGADINFLADIKTPEQGEKNTQESKEAGIAIENLGKPVICALNGFALGGGLELALCCSAILCRKGLSMAAGQPEVNLGIIPGAGGTQRLPRWIGLERAARMLRTGKPISGQEAVEWGLCLEEVEGGDLIPAALTLARAVADGKKQLRVISREPLVTPAALPDLDLGHLSQAIDRIVCRAILEGCRKPLSEGLRFESAMFGECVKTQDMRIGIENFLKNGPRAKAPFQHN